MKELGSQIYRAVKVGKLNQPFNPRAVKTACTGWDELTYSTFLPKHRVGNPRGNTELFMRVSRGLYEILPEPN